MGEFDTPLVQTSPLTTGKKVRDAQWLLIGHNAFRDDKFPLATLTGRLDGQYGPVTAGATKEAKFELGYPTAQIDTVFGQTLYEYLIGKQELPDVNKHNRKMRMRVPTKVKVLERGITQLGTKESPFGSNRQKYGEWYGVNGVKWCAEFVSWCISLEIGWDWKSTSVAEITGWAAQGSHYLSITYNPEPGDLVAYTLHGVVDAHIEIYEKDLENGSFSAVGGNTGPISISNGGEVARNVRYDSQVHHFMRLSLP